MKKIKLLELPLPSTAMTCSPTLRTEGSALLLSINLVADDQLRPICLRFLKQRAFRKRAEIYCTEWHVQETFDTVCEVQDSDWVNELRNDSVPEWRTHWVMRHFMIYLDGFGCLEVVSESATLDDLVKNSGGT